MANAQFCNNCIHGLIDHITYDIRCARSHQVRFKLPTVQLQRQDYTQHWGFVPVRGSCSDYRTIFDKPRSSHKQARGSGHRWRTLARIHSKAHVPINLPKPRPIAEVNNGIRLPIRDLPGLKALEEKYASELKDGKAASKRYD